MEAIAKPQALESSGLPLLKPCKYSRYLYFNTSSHDTVSSMVYVSELANRYNLKYKYVFDRVNKQCYLTSYDTDEEWLMLTAEQQAEVLADGSWKE